MKSIVSLIICFLILIVQNHPCTAQTNCWAQTIEANDPPWPGYENLTIRKAIKVSDGFVVCGTANEAIFPSRNGDTVGRTNFGGPFVAKYDFNGNLIWLNYGIDDNYAIQSIWSTITSITADANDNIYICGKFPPGSQFYYNDGLSSIKISAIDSSSTAYSSGEFIARLNPQGVPVWHNVFYGTTASFVANIANKGVVVAGQIEYYNSGYIKNGDTTTTFNLTAWPGHPQYLYWIDSSGNLLHHAMTSEDAVNYRGFIDVETDAAGNVVVAGIYERNIRFYNENQTDSVSIVSPTGGLYGSKFYAIKYDTTGTIQWKVHDRNDLMATSQMVNGSEAIDIDVAPNGTVYVSTQGYHFNYNDTVYFFNADNTYTQIQGGEKMIYSINDAGMLKWNAKFYSQYYSGISASDSDVVFAGTRWYPDVYPSGYTDTIYSVNNPAYGVLHSHSPNFHFIRYDSAGTVLNTGVIGNALGTVHYSSIGILRGTEGSYISYGNFQGLSGVPYQQFFDDTLMFNGYSAFMLNYNFNSCDTISEVYHDPVLFIDYLSSDSLCAGQSFVLYDSIAGDFFGNNSFKVQLSDANGNFGNPVQLAIGNVPSDSFVCYIPPGQVSGSGYKIRLISTYYNRSSQSYPVTILGSPPVSLVLTATPVPASPDTMITFIAQPTNSGNSPVFQWKINGSIVPGQNNDTFATSMLNDGDTVTVEMTSSLICALPKVITSSYIIQIPTSINEIDAVNKITFYPNPTNRTLNFFANFPTPTLLDLTLKNMLGQTVYQERNQFLGTVKCIIQLPDLPSGNYILEFDANGRKKNAKLIILNAR